MFRNLYVTNRLLRAGRRLLQVAQSEGLTAIIRKASARMSASKTTDPFDRQHGVQTAGKVSLFQLDICSPHEAAGFAYQPSPVDLCDRLFASLPIHHEDFTFIDLGAGKGRVLLVASRFPFKRVIGVEFARELVHVARRNIELSRGRAQVVHADAADYEFPSDNLVIYLYNPFGPEVLRPVLSSLREISTTREVYLLYLNPRNDSCVAEFAHEIYRHDGAKVYHF